MMLPPIKLPWPHRDLSPNARVHWRAKWRATKAARATASNAALAAGIRRISADKLTLTVTYAPPDGQKYDTDNLISRSKAFFDGIADVVGVDDCLWCFIPIKAEPQRPYGAVFIQIEAA